MNLLSGETPQFQYVLDPLLVFHNGVTYRQLSDPTPHPQVLHQETVFLLADGIRKFEAESSHMALPNHHPRKYLYHAKRDVYATIANSDPVLQNREACGYKNHSFLHLPKFPTFLNYFLRL